MSLEIPSPVLSAIKEGLACVAIGTIVGTALYGITVLQTYIYYKRYPNDALTLKKVLEVGVLCVLDTLTSALIAYGIYKYLVIYFMAPVENFLVIFPTLATEVGVTTLIAVLTQGFFAHRLWYFSHNYVLAGGIFALALAAFVPGIVLTVHLFTNRTIWSLGSFEVRVLSGLTNGLSVLCDILIAAGLCYYLRSSKSAFKRTNSMVDRLMIYAIQRGALTALCQAGHMITTVAFPGRFLFLPFQFLQGKLYCNTLLATLNVRNSLRSDGRQDHLLEPGSQILRSMQQSSDVYANGRQQHDGTGKGSLTLGFVMPLSMGEVNALATYMIQALSLISLNTLQMSATIDMDHDSGSGVAY
ncbi:hypothetical protein C8Q74DRAFT_1370430 [Fomes fomentarius]|nr:hypothetical protein C8Q74DRAFT_1370430 [Fomes fomentarius]